MHIRISHVDLSAQHHLALLYLTALHSLEQTQVLLDGTIAVGRVLAGLGRRTLLLGDLLGRLLIYIGLTLLDEADSQVVELLEVVAGVVDLPPTEAEPLDVALDAIYVLHVLLSRISVVETQVADAVVLLRNTEVHADSLDVTDMQVAVRLGRETRLNTSVVLAFTQVLLYDLLNEIETFFLLFHVI